MSMLAELHREHIQRRIRLGAVPLRPLPIIQLSPPIAPKPRPRIEFFGPFLPTPKEIDRPIAPALRRTFIIKQIINRIASDHDISPAAIIGPNRYASLTRPRFIAIYLVRAITSLSMPEIGKRFGYRDHTTILNALKKTHRRARADFQFGSELAAIECAMRRQNP
jgi:hypothetical protein